MSRNCLSFKRSILVSVSLIIFSADCSLALDGQGLLHAVYSGEDAVWHVVFPQGADAKW